MDSSTRRGRIKNLVGFLVGGVHYAVDIFRVREIINPLPLVQLPHAPPSVVGVADHRGEVVPVVDLRRHFGLEPAEPTRRTKWILVSRQAQGQAGAAVGLVVDEVNDVFGAGQAEQRNVPALGPGDAERGIAGVFSVDGKLTFVVDVDAVAASAGELDLGEMKGATR